VTALGLLCLAVMVLALAGAWPLPRAPWLWHVVAAVLALAGALVAFGLIKV
jgi:hypothetical protein